MQKSLQEQSPYKKRGDQLSSSDYSNRSGGELTNYTEIMISTNNKEVPFISIFKPDSTKEHSRIQGATIIQKSIRYFQRARMRLGLRKMIDARQHQIRVLEKCKALCQMGKRHDKALMTYAFLKMRQNKMKSKAVCLAAKTLNRFQTNVKVYNKKYAFYKLQIHFYNACIAEIKDSNELCRKITNLQSQMQSIKLSAYSEHFASKVKGYQRYIGNFIQNVKKNDLQGVLRHQIKRFQQQRLKMTPRRREAFENELVIIIITNLIKGYESKIVQFASKIEQMQCKIADLQSNEEMQTLRQQLQMRNEEIHKINQLFDEMDTFSAQIKRTMTKNRNHQNLNALSSIISTYTKKLQSFETQQSEGVINKMAKSGKTLCQVINILCQQGTSRQVRKKQAQFKVQQGETAMSTRFFNALQRTLISTQVPSLIIRQILLFKQHFQSIDSKYEQQVHQRIAYQSLVEEMTMISSQLKQQNENLKAFQKNYYDLVCKSKEKDTMMETLTNSILDKDKEIESLYQKVKQITLTGMNAASREKIDIGCKPRQRTVQLMKQLLTLKISIQNQIMVHQKEVRQMKNEIFEYQTVINQLQAEIMQKDHRIAKEKEDNKKLQERVAQMSKFDIKQYSPYILSGPQNIQYELSAVRQENEMNKTQTRQAKQNNQVLTKQINQIKRQFYKRQKVLQQKIRQKDESLSRYQMGSNELSNNATPTFQLSQSPNLKGPQIMARDQEIQLLTTKVKSLQALLNDITAQYHDLQVQFQHINAFPLTPDISEVKQTETKMPLAIREMENYAFMDDKVLSQKLKELMGSCESLAYSIDFAKQGLEQHIIEKRNESLHEKDSLLHLVFSILLDAQKIGPDSQQASKIWKELIQIKTNTTSKDLLTNLQSYSKDIIAKSIKK